MTTSGKDLFIMEREALDRDVEHLVAANDLQSEGVIHSDLMPQSRVFYIQTAFSQTQNISQQI
jgi:hypothetical protein